MRFARLPRLLGKGPGPAGVVKLPIVDARSGQVLRVGDRIPHDDRIIVDVDVGLTTAKVWATAPGGRITCVRSPVKWFPRLTYGPAFPVGGLRVVMLPT